jgi:hypothetical protein
MPAAALHDTRHDFPHTKAATACADSLCAFMDIHRELYLGSDDRGVYFVIPGHVQ